MKIDFFLDFETRSRQDLKKVNTIRYATDPSTEATLLTYCFGRTGQVKAWHIGQQVPEEIMDVVRFPEKYNFIAFNVGFDYLIWMHAFAKGQISPRIIPLECVHDAMALTSHFRVGNSLEAAAQMFGLPMEKDKEGRRIMLKQCKPGRNGQLPELTPSEQQAFVRYGLLDTRILREVYYRCPRLPASERWVWEWTFRRNLSGIRVDVDLINELHSIVEENRPKLEKEFKYLTGGKFTMRSSAKCKEWFQQFWPGIKDMRKDTVRDMLMDTEGKPPHAVRALKIKEMAGSSSIAKVDVAVRQTYFGRIYMTLKYHTAQTKRWAGAGIQIQNIPRQDNTYPDPIDFELDVTDLVDTVRRLRPDLKSPLQFVKNLLRRIWIPESGYRFYCGDFSKVEPTVLRWLAGMGEIPPLVYEEMAEAIYSVPIDQISKESEERQVGKAAELGGGYGMGHKRFKGDTYEKTGIVLTTEMAQHVIRTYRKKNKPIVDMWRELESAFRRAVNGEASWVCGNKIAIGPMAHPHRGVQIRLPSGGHLYYHQAYVKWEEETQEIVTMDANGQAHIEYKKVMRENLYYRGDDNGRVKSIKLYGGQLTEHVTSAISRELLTPAMWRLEQAGFDILCSIHDEVWAQALPGRDDEFRNIMIQRPSWAPDIVLDAGMDNGLRYLK